MANVLNIPPNGTIKLYNNIDIGNGRQPIFSSRANQIAYYNAHLAKTIDGMSYMRMGDKIKIEATVDEMTNVNFMSFVNRMGGTEREIYCYIDPNWEYINNNTIAISYSVASFQTMMFDLTFKPGQIQREHMSEADWQDAVARPYIDRHQLLTTEPLPAGKDLEKLINASELGGRMKIMPDQGSFETLDGDCWLILMLANANFDDINGWAEIISSVQSAGGYYTEATYLSRVPSVCAMIAMQYYDTTQGPSDPKVTVWRNIFTTIEANALTGNIMGLYYVPKYYIDCVFDSGLDTASVGIPIDSPAVASMAYKPDGYTPRNPKLYRYPYSFIRVTSNDGQKKEYACENFTDQAGASPGSFFFAAIPILNGSPSVCLAPYHYMFDTDNNGGYLGGTDPSWVGGLNLDAGITYSDIPHIPYATDGYVAYLASQARSVVGSLTMPDAIANTANSLLSGVSGVLGMAQAFNPDSNAGLGDRVSAVQSGMSQIQSAYKSRGSTMLGYNTANDIVKNPVASVGDSSAAFDLGFSNALASTRTADNVTAGSNTGFLQYLKNPIRFTAVRVVLRDDVVDIYDRWFDYYGYASTRIGVPYVVSYFQGGDDQPHFASVDGDTVTYAKARVFCYGNSKAPKMMCDDIEQMFANGTLFVKKD